MTTARARRSPPPAATLDRRDQETRDRLLAVAEQLFAERGFKRVTIRDICRDAHANVAAVNYHFGDKLGLYREVLRTAVNAMRGTLEAAQAAGRDGGAEDRIRAYVTVFLERVAASGESWIHRLFSRELVDPTPALDMIVQQAIRPRMIYLRTVVGELLGCPPDDERVARCAHSIHALCVSVIPNPVTTRLYPDFKLTPPVAAALADHITAFSLAGVQVSKALPGKSRIVRARGKLPF